MEEPMEQIDETRIASVSSKDLAVPKVFDYSAIVAERFSKPFDYKTTHGRQPPIQLQKKTYEELIAQVEKDSDDSDDDEPIELHASYGERSIKPLTNVPIVHAFNLAENRMTSRQQQK